MLAVLGLALVGCLPQAPASSTQPRIATTPNGWPAAGQAAAPPAATPPEAPPSATTATTEAARDLASEPGGFASRGPTASPLEPVFLAVGSPADAAGLGGVRVGERTVVFDHRGASMGERTASHEADLARPNRDRLLAPNEQVFGRDGQAVFAQYRGIAFPGLEAEARDELAWRGLLLRTPWAFADSSAYAVGAREELLWDDRPMSRFRIARRTTGNEVGDRYELWCEPGSSEPRVLVILPADPAARACRVRFLEFTPIGNVRLAMRWVVEAADGARRLEVELSDLRTSQAFAPRHFAPPPR